MSGGDGKGRPRKSSLDLLREQQEAERAAAARQAHPPPARPAQHPPPAQEAEEDFMIPNPTGEEQPTLGVPSRGFPSVVLGVPGFIVAGTFTQPAMPPPAPSPTGNPASWGPALHSSAMAQLHPGNPPAHVPSFNAMAQIRPGVQPAFGPGSAAQRSRATHGMEPPTQLPRPPGPRLPPLALWPPPPAGASAGPSSPKNTAGAQAARPAAQAHKSKPRRGGVGGGGKSKKDCSPRPKPSSSSSYEDPNDRDAYWRVSESKRPRPSTDSGDASTEPPAYNTRKRSGQRGAGPSKSGQGGGERGGNGGGGAGPRGGSGGSGGGGSGAGAGVGGAVRK